MLYRLATYTGQRLTTSNTLAHFWLFEGDDKAVGFKRLFVPAVIGQTWKFTLVDAKDHTYHTAGEHRPRLDSGMDARALSWTATQEAHRGEHANAKALAKLKRAGGELDELLAPVRKFIQATPDFDTRQSLIRHIQNRLNK